MKEVRFVLQLYEEKMKVTFISTPFLYEFGGDAWLPESTHSHRPLHQTVRTPKLKLFGERLGSKTNMLRTRSAGCGPRGGASSAAEPQCARAAKAEPEPSGT